MSEFKHIDERSAKGTSKALDKGGFNKDAFLVDALCEIAWQQKRVADIAEQNEERNAGLDGLRRTLLILANAALAGAIGFTLGAFFAALSH